MYRNRCLKVLVDSIADTNPECGEKTCEGNDAPSKVTRVFSYPP